MTTPEPGEYCLFVFWESGSTVADVAADALRPCLGAIAGLRRAIFHLPQAAIDPLLREEHVKQAVLQLYFDDRGPMDEALRTSLASCLEAIGRALPALSACETSVQAMRVCCRRSPGGAASVAPSSVYLAGYEGGAEDHQPWIDEYLRGHVGLMQQLPGLRHLEVYARLSDSPASLAAQRWMLRNKVVFDDARVMQAALTSPIRGSMKAHRAGMPALPGRTEHEPMIAYTLVGA